MVDLTVCYYHDTYGFPSESTVYSFLNVKELLAQNRCNIWSLSDSNGFKQQPLSSQTKTQPFSQIGLYTLNGWEFVYELSSCRLEYRFCHLDFIATVLSKEFLDIQATIECRFTLKRVRDMTITYSSCNKLVRFKTSQYNSRFLFFIFLCF